MVDIWKEREKALENEYIYKQEQEKLERLRHQAREQLAHEHCLNRCPKCGEELKALTFRDVPLDQCPGCKGIWLGPNDLQILSAKDHRSWFEKWFKEENNEE